MGTGKLCLMKTQFSSVYRKLVFFIRVLWVSLFSSLFNLFGFIRHYVFRLQEKIITQKRVLNFDDKSCKTLIEEQEDDEEKETVSFLRFRFPTFEEFAQSNNIHVTNDQTICENSDDEFQVDEGMSDDVVSENCSEKIEFVEEIVEPQINSVSVQGDEIENFIDECHEISAHVHSPEANVEDLEVENEDESSHLVKFSTNNISFIRRMTNIRSDDESTVSDSDTDSMVSSSKSSFRSSFIDSLSDGFLSDIDFERAFEIDVSKEFSWKELKLYNQHLMTEEDRELQELSRGYGSDDVENEDEDILQELKNIEADIRDENDHILDSEDDSDMESELPSEHDTDNSISVDLISNSDEQEQPLESNLVDVINISDTEDNSIADTATESIHNAENPSSEKQLNSTSEDLKESNNKDVDDSSDSKQESNVETALDSEHNAENSSSGEQLSSDSDQNGLEQEWEHQDLVEQLKMEIKKVRAIGLPTILEESESPKIMDDFKPWKIEKYQHEGTLDELHKFYKSYRERMRKLDILNYQKMYAIGFLKLKDPVQSFTRNRISTHALATIISVDCWPCKPKSTSEVHQPVMKKFTRELENDLEMVYVGQMCLSWEFLCWEYGKALELWDSDPHGVRRYNDVAGKFQTFQVFLTRFLEDDPLQGPRVLHYVKSRCVLRNLLHVPVIRDDEFKERRKKRKLVSSKDAITSLQLLEIIEESIRVLWQFIRSDKESSNAILAKCLRSSDVELQNPADAVLLAEVRTTLQKKDKKLREITRGENCMLRSFQRHHEVEDGSDHVLYFFSRVDLKLVSRVLNMSRISTEQLVWCKDKLNMINFVGTKLHVEPSVLLFPCS